MKRAGRNCGAVIAAALLGAPIAEASTVAYWRFEQGPADAAASAPVTDLTSHHLDLTPVGNPPYRSDRPVTPVPQTGAINNFSLEFNAAQSSAQQRLFIPDNSLFQLTHSLTLEAYVKVFALPQGADGESQIAFRGDDRAGLDPYFLELHTDQVRFEINAPDGQAASVSAPLPVMDQWVHLAGTLNDATGQMRLYINGTPAATTTTNLRPLGALDPTANPGLGIGNVQSAKASEYFHGLIDEVRVSDRPLTPNEFLLSPLLPDANGDGSVDFADLLILAQNYGKTDVGFEQGDFNSDSKVDFGDLLTLAQRYGDHFANPSSAARVGAADVPEPALAAAIVALLPLRRKRT